MKRRPPQWYMHVSPRGRYGCTECYEFVEDIGGLDYTITHYCLRCQIETVERALDDTKRLRAGNIKEARAAWQRQLDGLREQEVAAK